MTKDEIKQAVTMREVLANYGLKPNRKGFIACPFHNETKPSMIIHKKRFHCFGCHKKGDVFDFVMNYESLSFTDAIKRLGGEEKPSFAVYTKARQKKIEQDKARKRIIRKKNEFKKAGCYITAYKKIIANEEANGRVFSDLWSHCMNRLTYQLYLHEYYSKEVR